MPKGEDDLEAVREALTLLVAEGKGDEAVEAAMSIFGALRDTCGCCNEPMPKIGLFFKLVDSDPRAAVVLDLVAKIYRVEKDARARELDADAWRDLRQRRTVP